MGVGIIVGRAVCYLYLVGYHIAGTGKAANIATAATSPTRLTARAATTATTAVKTSYVANVECLFSQTVSTLQDLSLTSNLLLIYNLGGKIARH